MCEGLRDYVGLWQIVRFVADEAHAQSEEALQAAVLEELSRLLDASVFEAVDLVEGGGSEAWPGDVNDILTRIREEWNLRGSSSKHSGHALAGTDPIGQIGGRADRCRASLTNASAVARSPRSATTRPPPWPTPMTWTATSPPPPTLRRHRDRKAGLRRHRPGGLDHRLEVEHHGLHLRRGLRPRRPVAPRRTLVWRAGADAGRRLLVPASWLGWR